MIEEDGYLAPALEAEPQLEPRQAALLDAFFILCPDRPLGMGGVGAIPTTAILAMAKLMEEEPWPFLVLCRALDGVYLRRVNKATSQEKPAQ